MTQKLIKLTRQRIERQNKITIDLIKSLLENKNLNIYNENLRPLSPLEITTNTVIPDIFSLIKPDELSPSNIKNLKKKKLLKEINGSVFSQLNEILISPGINSGFFTKVNNIDCEYLSSIITNPAIKKQNFANDFNLNSSYLDFIVKVARTYKETATISISGFGSSSVSNLHAQMFSNQGKFNDRRVFDKSKKWLYDDLYKLIPQLWEMQVFYNIVFDGDGDIFVLFPRYENGDLISFLKFDNCNKAQKCQMVELLINKPGGLESINDNDRLYVDKTPILEAVLYDAGLREKFETIGILDLIDVNRFSKIPSNLCPISPHEIELKIR